MDSVVGTKSNIQPSCCKETQGNAVDIITCLSVRAHYNQPCPTLTSPLSARLSHWSPHTPH